MGKLSEQEARELERLTKKRESPDPEPVGRVAHATIDFGKKDQVELARRYGFLNDPDDGGSGGESGDGDGEGGEGEGGGGGAGGRKPDKAPKRGGYFG